MWTQIFYKFLKNKFVILNMLYENIFLKVMPKCLFKNMESKIRLKIIYWAFLRYAKKK